MLSLVQGAAHSLNLCSSSTVIILLLQMRKLKPREVHTFKVMPLTGCQNQESCLLPGFRACVLNQYKLPCFLMKLRNTGVFLGIQCPQSFFVSFMLCRLGSNVQGGNCVSWQLPWRFKALSKSLSTFLCGHQFKNYKKISIGHVMVFIPNGIWFLSLGGKNNIFIFLHHISK
jgi:hypothetical protein